MGQIDKVLGMSYYGNDEALYREILECYCEQAQEYMKSLVQYVEAKDWKHYMVVIHAIKSNSLGIGAKKFSELAFQHEKESKMENRYFIEENFDAFMENYKELLEEVTQILHNV